MTQSQTPNAPAGTIRFGFGDTSLGGALVAESPRGVAAILLGDDRAQLRRSLAEAFPTDELVEDPAGMAGTLARALALIEAPHLGSDLPLDLRGSELEVAVWAALRAIPAGETRTYGAIARSLPVAATAQEVGAACAANRLAVAIPCHRVVKADGFDLRLSLGRAAQTAADQYRRGGVSLDDAGLALEDPRRADGFIRLGPQAGLLAGFAAPAAGLVAAVSEIAAAAAFRRMVTPGGREMSVAMTNCGAAGWVSDRRGYRYQALDPATGRPWPAMPDAFIDLARRAAAAVGFHDFRPDACLISRYAPGARLSLHQDRDERDLAAPVVSVSLGLPAVFLWGGATRSDRPAKVRLIHGDVVVWGGTDRLAFHGVDTLADGVHPLTGAVRFNLSFRKAL